MRFVEETGGSWTAEQLRAAEAEIEQQKREWEANRLATLKKVEEDARRATEEENDLLTYSREDAQNQVNKFNKRRPINRRLLSIKSNTRKLGNNIKKAKGKVMGKSAKKSPITSTRRVLRNNIKISNNLGKTSNSVNSRNASTVNDIKQVKRAKTNSRKRVATSRINSRNNRSSKRSCRNEMVISSDDHGNSSSNDVDTIEVSDSDDDITITNNKQAHPSECSDLPRSEEFDDSECSLDVMVDSTDPQESDSDNTDENNEDDAVDNDVDEDEDEDDDDSNLFLAQSDAYSISSQEDVNSSDEYSKENISGLNSTAIKPADLSLDINSPRTRSHGRVKINLWTLDVSQILPELRAKRQSVKQNCSKINATKICLEDSEQDELNDQDAIDSGEEQQITCRNSRAARKNVTLDNGSNNGTNNFARNRSLRTNKSLERLTKSMTISATPTTNFSTTLNAAAPKLVKKNNDKFNVKSGSGKSINTLDSWISISTKSPKIILDKNECDQQRQIQQQRHCLTVNSHREKQPDISRRKRLNSKNNVDYTSM